MIRSSKSGKLLVIIAMLGLLLFNLVFFFIPLIWSMFGSLHNWNPLVGTKDFVGFANYGKILLSPLFRKALQNTLFFTTVAVLARTALGLLLAVGIVSVVKGRDLLRSFYFLPVIMPIVAVSLIWNWIYHPRIGLLNFILAAFGITGPSWLSNASLAMPAVLAMTVWKDIGYAIIIYIAAYLNIPKYLYEAAVLDGAHARAKFFYITIPMLKPITIFVVITSLITYFQSFVQIFIMTKGGTGDATHVLSYLIFHEAFTKYRFGYASALSVFLFLIIMMVTLFQYKLLKSKERA